MQTESVLFHHDREWHLLADGKLTRLSAYPTLERSTLAISDFGQASTDMSLFEGNPNHATALIEKKMRADGTIDHESKILIHQIKRFGRGYQALYTAVTLSEWQHLTTWSGNQADHCPLVPLAALLWSSVSGHHGVLLRHGRHLVFMAAVKQRMLYASAITFSESEDDLNSALLNLAATIGEQIRNDEDDIKALSIRWATALAEDSMDLDTQLAQRFSEQTGMSTVVVEADAFQTETGQVFYSALPRLAAAASVKIAVNDGAAKAMYLAERALPWASVCSIVLAALLSVQAGTWAVSAGKARQQSVTEMRESEPARRETAALAATRVVPADFAAQQTFLARADELSSLLDPIKTLNTLRVASAGGVRILRVYLVTTRPTQRGELPENVLTVDGVIDTQNNDPGSVLARFVAQLRAGGYEAISMDPNATSASSQPPAGFFSYQLRRPIERVAGVRP